MIKRRRLRDWINWCYCDEYFVVQLTEESILALSETSSQNYYYLMQGNSARMNDNLNHT